MKDSNSDAVYSRSDSSIGCGDGERKQRREWSGRGSWKLLGEPKLPQIVACSCCYYAAGLLFLFVYPSRKVSHLGDSSRIRDQSRANGLLWSLSERRSCDPTSFVAALGQFYCYSTGCGISPGLHPSPKESVSCASAILFLLCWSRYVLFLFCCFACYCCCANTVSRWRANFLNSFIFNGLTILGGNGQAQKSRAFVTDEPGFCYGACPR
ncbi:hypothetical protein D9M71_245380 [compost metagenome]